jgi:AcrR family transcriptional regulator
MPALAFPGCREHIPGTVEFHLVMPLETPPPWRARRRALILNAAADLFARQPYGAVQMDDVAQHAGVGKATLYRYFPSKEELFLETFEAALAATEARLVREAAANDPVQALSRIMDALVETFAGHLPTLRAMSGDHAHIIERSRQVLRRRLQSIRAVIRSTIARGMDDGRFREVDLDVTPQLLIGMVRAGVMGAPDVGQERITGAILDLLLGGGLAGHPQSPNATPRALAGVPA